jgi:hypothetical protein
MGVPFRIFEFQWIFRDEIDIVFDEGARINDTINPPPSRDLKMVVAFWANLEISLDDPSIDHFITRITFDPKRFGDWALLAAPLFFLFVLFLFKPGHPFQPSLSMELTPLEGLWPRLRVATTSNGRIHTGS